MERLKTKLLIVTVLTLISGQALRADEGPWIPAGLQGNNIWAIEVSPSGWILAGTAISLPKTMFRSTDLGATWTEVAGLPDEVEIWDIESDPTDESIVYAALNGAGVYKSMDGGINWTWSNLYGQIWELDVSPSNPSVIWVASQTGGAYKSTDAGASFDWVSQGVFDNATAVAVDPTNPAIALAGTPFDGIFRTVDGGSSWSQANAGFGYTPWVIGLLFDPVDPSIVYAGEWWNGVYKSLDGGVTWFRPDPTLFARVGGFATMDEEIFIFDLVETSGSPALRTRDGGLSWEPLARQPEMPGNLWPQSIALVPGAVLLGTSIGDNPGGIYLWQLPVTVDTVLDWVDQAVDEGDIEGTGAGKSANKRLQALISMIELTAELIDAGMIDEACDQLLDVLLKTDGQPRPPDFIEGPEAETLADSIRELMTNTGCD